MRPAPVDRESKLPLHEQFKQLLLEKIRGGGFKHNEQIPTERELSEEYGLSRTTVRQSINELVARGYLQRVQGRGTFVTKWSIPLNLHNLTSFSDDMRARGKTPSSRVLSLGLVQPEAEVAEALDAKGKVTKIERIRLADGKVVGLHTVFLPPEYLMTWEELERSSLYALLFRKFHLMLDVADETLKASSASESEAQMLETEVGKPILKIVRLSYDGSGVPKEFVKMLYLADEYEYYVRLKRY